MQTIPTQRWQPHAYQKRAVKFGLERGAAGFFMDPGLGKTSVMLAIITVLRKRGMIGPTLVVAPLRVAYSVWGQEAAKWEDFKHLRVTILHGKDKAARLATIGTDDEHDVYVINHEGLAWLEGLNAFGKFDVLVVDESTKFKHTNTQRFKLMRKVIGKFRRRYILTGTPAPNGLIDLFGQIFLLDGGHALGRFITHFRNKWFDPTGFGGYTWVPREGAEADIYKTITPLVLRLDEQDYLELPEKVVNTVVVELPEKARRIYDRVEEDFVAALRGGEIIAKNAAVASGKLRQIASGGVYLDDGRVEHLHDAKTEATIDLVEELSGQPTLIAYDTHHDLERLQRAFGADLPFIGGGVSATRSQQIVDAWNRGELPILALQPQSAAHGLNLQRGGRAVIWYSLTWDLEAYDQLIRRVWRQGQTQRVFIYHVLAANTIDSVILARLQQKDRGQRDLLDALRAYYLKRGR